MENKFNITTNQSEKTKKLAQALVNFDKEIENYYEKVGNGFPVYKFLDVESYLEKVQPFLSNNTLFVVQLPNVDKKAISVRTILFHKSGEWKSSTVNIPLMNGETIVPYPPQSKKTLVNYAKRCGIRKILSHSTIHVIEG